jgi:FlaA1/EpsC-like NDP-sugar epimerase
MFKELKDQFIQIAFTTTILVVVLFSFLFGNVKINVEFLWHIVGIAILTGAIFGVVYPYCWNYSTWKAHTNIVVTTLINSIGGYSALYLFSEKMFKIVIPYWWGVLLLTSILHVLTFYFYRKNQNQKLINQLNKAY